MDHWEVVSAIFSEKLDCCESGIEAISNEQNSFWCEAQSNYLAAIKKDVCESRKDFYYESFFKCSAQLSDWNFLGEEIEATMDVNEDEAFETIWTDDWYKRKILPWYLKSRIYMSLTDVQKKQKLLEAINKILTDPEKKDFFKGNFSEELAFLWLTENRPESAKLHLNNYSCSFLSDWAELNPLFVSTRSRKLADMQNVAQMTIFSELYASLNEDNAEANLTNLFNVWSSGGDAGRSLPFYERQSVYRHEFLRLLRRKCDNLKLDADEVFDEQQFNINLKMVRVALAQGNYKMGKKYVETFHSTTNQQEFLMKLNVYKIVQLKGRREKELSCLLAAWDKAGNYFSLYYLQK